jgi:hypothetical protein
MVAAASDIQELPIRFRPIDVLPEKMAPLLKAAMLPNYGSRELREALKSRLLDLTVHNAIRCSPFYAKRFAGLQESALTGQDFAALPLLRRSDLEQAGTSIYSQYADYLFTSYTSGTTSEPLLIDRSKQEQAYLSRLLSLLHKPSTGSEPLVLLLATWYHGRQLSIPGSGYCFPVSLSNTAGYRQAKALLKRSFKIDGKARQITSLAGGLVGLLALTEYIESLGDPDLPKILHSLQSTSHYVSSMSRSRLENFWGCRLQDRFSFTELFFSAANCPTCNYYHFEPYGQAEVIDTGSRMPIAEGVGELAVTGFYPFTQMTPLIRYLTGDIVEIRRTDCPQGAEGFHFFGRTESCVDTIGLTRLGGIIGGGQLVEALESIEEINRPRLEGQIPESAKRVAGLPKFRISRTDERVILDLELASDAAMEIQDHSHLRAEVVKRFRAQSLSAAELEDKGRLQIQFHGPGLLPNSTKFRP